MKKTIKIAIATLMLAGIFAGAATSFKAANGQDLQPKTNISTAPCPKCA